MSGFEQHVEAPDRRWQYLLFAAEPYETISFKVISSFLMHYLIFLIFQIPSREVDKSEGKFWTYYNTETKQVFFFLY
jgi:splicing factor 3A subunit 2